MEFKKIGDVASAEDLASERAEREAETATEEQARTEELQALKRQKASKKQRKEEQAVALLRACRYKKR